jgi:hypothetical protein
LQASSKVNEGNFSNTRRDSSRLYGNKRREYLIDRNNELELDSTIKNIGEFYRGKNRFKEIYQPRTYTV